MGNGEWGMGNGEFIKNLKMGKTEVRFYVGEARKSVPEFWDLVLVVGLLEAALVLEYIRHC